MADRVTSKVKTPFVPKKNVAIAGVTPDAFGAGIGRAVEGLGKVVQLQEKQSQAAIDKGKKFKALQAFNDFQRNFDTERSEFEREAEADGSDYLEGVQKIYNNNLQKLQKTVTSLDGGRGDISNDINLRADETLNVVKSNALKQQRARQDANELRGIDDQVRAARKRIFEQGGNTAQELQSVFDLINNSSLPAEAKRQATLEADKSLKKIDYKQKKTLERRVEKNFSRRSLVDKIVGVESNGNASAKNPNSSALGLGQFTKSTWLALVSKKLPGLVKGMDPGQILNLRRDPKLSRLMIKALAEDNAIILNKAGISVNDGTLYLAHFLGPGGAVKAVKSNPAASALSVLGSKVINANPFLKGKNISQVVDWAFKKMNGKDTFNPSTLDSDPVYKNLTLNERLAIQRDIDVELSRSDAASAKAFTAREQSISSAISQSIAEKDPDVRSQFQRAIDSGFLQNGKLIRTLNTQITKAEKDTVNYAAAQKSKERGPSAFVGSDGNKSANLLFNESGTREGIANLSEEAAAFLTSEVRQIGIISSDARSQLINMLRAGKQDESIFALQTLTSLENANPRAFKAAFPEDVKSDVNFFNDASSILTPEQMFTQLRGGDNTQRSAAKAVSDIVDKELVDLHTNGLDTEEILSGINSKFFGDAAPLNNDLVNQEVFVQAFDTRYKIERVKPNTTQQQAIDRTYKALSNEWSTTKVGGTERTIRYAPETLFPETLGGTKDWMNEEGRRQLGLTKDNTSTFLLQTDKQTVGELDRWRKNPSGPRPSYSTVIIDEGGVVKIGKRISFEWTPELQQRADIELSKAVVEEQDKTQVERVRRALQIQKLTGEPLNDQAVNDLRDLEARGRKVDDESLGVNDNPLSARERFTIKPAPLAEDEVPGFDEFGSVDTPEPDIATQPQAIINPLSNFDRFGQFDPSGRGPQSPEINPPKPEPKKRNRPKRTNPRGANN